jgi:uncharacterized protein (TIGR03118 family)
MKLRSIALSVALASALLFGASPAHAQYKMQNLVSNQPGVAAVTDPLLVNGWGITYPPGGPFWVSDNGSGFSTLYTNTGAKVALNVTIPTASGSGTGSPTGVAFNGSSDFQIKGSAAIFLFATLDGTISGWNPAVNATAAVIAVTRPGAVYTGLAITGNATGNFIYAADNANNRVDMYDGTFTLVKSFTDTTLPAGITPFGIQDFGGLLYITFANPNGAAGGFIDIFGEDGTMLKRLTSGAPLNQPWGLAIAPKNFGELSNALIVGNNTNTGSIHAFNAVTGEFIDAVKDTSGAVIAINQLWGLKFGDGTGKNGTTNQLFFTAGPNNNLAGLFGIITAQ